MLSTGKKLKIGSFFCDNKIASLAKTYRSGAKMARSLPKTAINKIIS
jgi:hypothetical protein